MLLVPLRTRGWLGHVWPVLRLRTIMFGMMLTVAALPGVAAIMLRVYENALVRQTEAELIAQSSALSASAAMIWPGTASGGAETPDAPDQAPPHGQAETYDRDMPAGIDLRWSPILPERPAATPAAIAADADALAVARRMAPVLAATRQETLAAILLLDRHGIILNGRDAGRSLAALPEVHEALSGRPATVLRHNGAYAQFHLLAWVSRSTDLRLHHAHPIFANRQVAGVVLVSRSPPALFRGLWEDRGKIALGTCVIFLLLVGMAAVLARTIVRPIERLSLATRALADGKQAHPPRPTLRVREIDGLIHDFTSMAAAIERRSHYLRDFAAALAHEFKTPLSGLTGGIELLQDHGPTMAESERANFLGNMAADADRLSRLISRLMELARADMRPALGHESCDPASVAALLADSLSARDFTLHLAMPDGLPRLAIGAPALETILTTLVDNARQAGARRVTITATMQAGHLHLTCADDGPGIPASDIDRIFEPFFTSKRVQGGTGLGLPIARALIEGNHGQLRHVPSLAGAAFEIILPVMDLA